MLERLVLRPLFIGLFKILFGLRIKGLEHYRADAGGTVIICNHQSFLDPLLLAVVFPKKPSFAMNVFQAQKWYFRWLSRIAAIYTLDPSKPMSMKSLIRDVEKGAHVVLFPEGRITTSGGIMKIYDGASLIIERTGAAILPVHIDGAQYSTLSFLKGRVRQRWLPRISVTLFAPVKPGGAPLPPQGIYDMLTEAAFRAAPYRQPLLAAVLDAISRHGGGKIVADDIMRAPMTYRQLLTRTFILAGKLNPLVKHETNIGVLLPNSLGVMVTFMSLHVLGKTPCMFNFSAGVSSIVHACRIAGVKTLLTSRVFIERGELESVIEALSPLCRIVYLEDVRKTVTLADKLAGLLKARFPRALLAAALSRTRPDDTAVILYTSGSEGVPKGVALSHANILSNIYQACARVDLNPSDTIFNALPVFHSFGLAVGMLLPLVQGVRVFLYPTPLHYRIIPDMVYDSNATVMLGTDTFFKGYAHYAHPYDFWRIRLAVAGAEKLKETTRRLWADKFCVHIFEGYGVTETSPVISVNTPLMHKEGTVGRPLPGIECRLAPVEGLDRGGRLEVKGPNVMLGYLRADNPGVIQPQGQDNGDWYDTGDIVDIDGEGYITILGRAKRFAKIGGEMVSLMAVEDLAAAISPDAAHAAIVLTDPRKGEQIILCTESKELTRDQMLQQLKAQGLTELCLPRQVLHVETLPRLGNGKIDYLTLTKQMQVAPS